ncbi:DUF5320 domain-containing protein [Candidatus Woesearchaeota archaeon]|nr:DUF5320 domain-containing protein [Candidatus Woesearchaeota archaeon]
MPGGDGTGPMGTGPIGWGMGPCGKGARRGLGRGRGLGWRSMGFFQAGNNVEMTKEQKIKVLEAEQAELEAELQDVKKALEKEKNA